MPQRHGLGGKRQAGGSDQRRNREQTLRTEAVEKLAGQRLAASEDQHVERVCERDRASFPGKLCDQRFDQDAEGKPHAAVDDEDQKARDQNIPAIRVLLSHGASTSVMKNSNTRGSEAK